MYTQLCPFRKKRKGYTKAEVSEFENDNSEYNFVRIILKT